MKWLAVLFSVFILGVIVLADEGLLDPVRRLLAFPYGDKVGHFVLYGLLAWILNTAFMARPPADPKYRVALLSLVLAMLISLEELSQIRFPNRSVDFVDLVSSYAGVGLFSYIAYRSRPR